MKKILLVLFLFPLSITADELPKLTSTQEAYILAGYHCCYADEVIENVLYKNQRFLMPKNKILVPAYIPQNALEEPADRWMWALFWTIQAADIYSTNRGIQYDCISEANPLLPSTPTIAEMAILKAVVLLPSYGSIGYENISREELIFPLLFGTGVVAHNMNLVHEAKNRCNLR